MQSLDDLKNKLERIDGRGYKAYKDIEGLYQCEEYILLIDHVQGDPFASPSRIRIRLSHEYACFPENTYNTVIRDIAFRDFLTRRFVEALQKICKGSRGLGNSGIISIDCPGQEILERTSFIIEEQYIEARFVLGLPASARKIDGKQAVAMFFDELPKIIAVAFYFKNIDRVKLYEHIETAEDASFLRDQLDKLGLVAFIADGSILPRSSGVDPSPLRKGNIVPFVAPDSLRMKVNLPNRGMVAGMGISKGITLIVGGGYHGKSTLLSAIAFGIYNHIPGDGRELVVINSSAVKIRSEDGRRIEKTCISPFISNLPFGQDTEAFSTDNASGSTSQSANIIETMEMGCQVLLVDEDTSATNFMIRDHRMQNLVSKDKEPIIPFIDKVQLLYQDHSISTIIVVGGSGDYFDVADCVICMVEYQPYDYTKEALSITEKFKAKRKKEGGGNFGITVRRIPLANSFDAGKGKKKVKISTNGLRSISFGYHNIDLSAIEQLVDISQTRAIGDAIYYARRFMDRTLTLKEVVDLVMSNIRKNGLDILSPWPVGNYAVFRGIELSCAINRLRTLLVQQKK